MIINPSAIPLTKVGGTARQGDTLLRRLFANASFPAKQTKTATLALGEKTGHHHTFCDGGAVGFADDEQSPTADTIRVEADAATLTHQEHSSITFPKGDYESLKQMEYNPEALRNVAD